MPQKFKKRLGNCRVIIDCTEFCIDRPYNLQTQARTWSNCKHKNTLKTLVGITLYGSMSFVSKMYNGCISDKEITEKSGFCTNVQLGDEIIADEYSTSDLFEFVDCKNNCAYKIML